MDRDDALAAGLWRFDPSNMGYANGRAYYGLKDSDGSCIGVAVFLTDGAGRDLPAEDRARLIAAAPTMLGALQHIVEYWNRDQNHTAMADALWHIIETAEAAIVEAKGV